MADNSTPSGANRGHLDASGEREVVYCHQCSHEWFKDQLGLVCPQCSSEVTEIVRVPEEIDQEQSANQSQITSDSDPRVDHDDPDSLPDLTPLNDHNPWRDDDNYSDPEEEDIEEHITHGPNGSVMFSRSFRAGPGHTRRTANPEDDPDHIMRDFQDMIGNMMGPGIRMGPPGRSARDDLFGPTFGGVGGPRVRGARMSTFRFGGGVPGPAVVGGRFSYTTGGLRPRDTDGPQAGDPPIDDLATYASPSNTPLNGRSLYIVSITARPDQLARLIGTLFGQMGAVGPLDDDEEGGNGRRGMPVGLQGLFASLLNPQNAVHGDAVYSQEAMDRIISTLMEQHPTSNAPGPAPPSAIAALPKKKLDEKMLGPEGKGECSVCMDDVHIGDEVVALPCNHWFHESCASAWLSEHNTCPICRKGLDAETPPPNSRRSSGTGTPRTEHRSHRMSTPRRSSRNEARLDAIRDRGRLSPATESGPSRWQVVGDRSRQASSVSPPEMPGGFNPSYRRRDSGMSAQREHHRRNTDGSIDSRTSQSGNGTNTGGGPMSWFRDVRDRFSSNRRNDP